MPNMTFMGKYTVFDLVPPKKLPQLSSIICLKIILQLELHVNKVDCLDARIAGKRMDYVACGVHPKHPKHFLDMKIKVGLN